MLGDGDGGSVSALRNSLFYPEHVRLGDENRLAVRVGTDQHAHL